MKTFTSLLVLAALFATPNAADAREAGTTGHPKDPSGRTGTPTVPKATPTVPKATPIVPNVTPSAPKLPGQSTRQGKQPESKVPADLRPQPYDKVPPAKPTEVPTLPPLKTPNAGGHADFKAVPVPMHPDVQDGRVHPGIIGEATKGRAKLEGHVLDSPLGPDVKATITWPNNPPTK